MMKQQQTNQGINVPIQYPANEKPSRFGRDSLTKACYGNDKIGSLLSFFIYEAGYEIKQQSLPESCNVVVFTRKLDQILTWLKIDLSKKTLIRYLDLLNEWGYVGSERYQKVYTVNLETIQNAVNTPPNKPKRPSYNRQKGCKSTTLQPSPNDTHELTEKVVTLQQKVDYLQQKVDYLQQKVDYLSTLQLLSVSVEKPDEGHFSAPIDTIDTYRSGVDTGTYGSGQSDDTEKEATASVVNDAPIPTTPITEKELPLEETTETEEITPAVPEPVIPPSSPEPTKPARNNKQPAKEEKPPVEQQKLDMPVLDAIQQAVYDEWCKMPWFHGVPPKITPAMPDTLKKLTAYSLTSEQMLEVKKWATSAKVDRTGYYKNKGWSIFFLANEIPKWLSAQPEKPAETKQAAPAPEPTQEILWTEDPDHKGDPVSNWYRYRLMSRLEAKEKYKLDYYGELPAGVITEINHRFKLEQLGKIKRPDIAIAS